MTAIRELDLFPPKTTTIQTLELYKKVTKIKSSIGKLNSELEHSR